MELRAGNLALRPLVPVDNRIHIPHPERVVQKAGRPATKSITVIVKASDVDQSQLEAGIREITGQSEAKVLSVKRREDRFGQEVLEVEVEHRSDLR